VVDSLDCNFLSGRDAMRAYGMDVIESGGYVIIGSMKVLIADHRESIVKCQILRQVNNSVVATKEKILRGHSTVLISISISTSLPKGKDLLFSPRNVVDQVRKLMGVMPCHLVRSSTPVIQFDNICNYPIKIERGQVLGSVMIFGPRTKMTYFYSPSVTMAETSLFLCRGVTLSPDTSPYSPWVPQEFNPWQPPTPPSRLDIMWNNLVDCQPVAEAEKRRIEQWIAKGRKTRDMRDVAYKAIRQEERAIRRNANSGKLDVERDRDVLKFSDHWKGQTVRQNPALEMGAPVFDAMVNKGLRGALHKRKEKHMRTLVMRSLGPAEDPEKLPTSPLGLEQERDESIDDQMVNEVVLVLEEPLRPCPELNKLTIKVDKHLTNEMRDQLYELMRHFTACFSFERKRLGDVQMPPMKIEVSGIPGTRSQAYRESPRMAKHIREFISMLADLDIIEKGTGPIAAPVVIIKQGEKWRFCVDFRVVNELTPIDRYPIPHPNAVFAVLAGAKFF